MPEPDIETHEITALLVRAGEGDSAARERLYPIVEQRLYSIAKRLFSEERSGHTLQPTALVDEVYVNLVCKERDWGGRLHFFAIASAAMRQVLARHARDRSRQKRGGARQRLTLSGIEPTGEDLLDLLDLDEALNKLEIIRPRLCRIVEHRLFSGLTNQETAESLGLSLRTIELEWRAARAWLRRELGGEGDS